MSRDVLLLPTWQSLDLRLCWPGTELRTVCSLQIQWPELGQGLSHHGWPPHLTPGVWMTSSTSWLLLARKFFFTFHFFHIAPDLIVGVGDRLAKRFHLLLWSNAQADLEQGGQLLNAERPTSTPLRENSGTVTSHPSVVKLSALNLAGRRVDPVFAALAHLIVREWCLA